MCSIKFKKKREAFEQEHDSELRQFHLSQRKLKVHFTKDGKLPLSRWHAELKKLESARNAAYADEYKPLDAEIKKLGDIRRHIDEARRHDARQTQQRKQDIVLS